MRSKLGYPTILALGFALFLSAVNVAWADTTVDGTVVSVTAAANDDDARLVIQDQGGKKEKTYTVSSSVKVTLDKKDVELKDLKKGDSVKLTVGEDDKVTAIDATRSKK